MQANREKKNCNKRFYLNKSLLLAGIVILSSCSGGGAGITGRPAVPVTTAAAVQKTMPITIRAIGTIEPYATIEVKSQVNGVLSRVHFKEGEDVGKGLLLFTIDPRPFETALRQAEAILAKDLAQLEHARVEEKRYASLAEKGYVAQQQYDQIRTTAEALEATVQADRAAVESAKLQLNYCYIHAPVSGRTGSLLVNEGNVIKANDDKAMVVIHQVQPVYSSFSVPEQDLLLIKKYMQKRSLPVIAFPDGEEHAAAKGVLTFVDNAVNTSTGTIGLKATFPNKDRRLWPGQFVNIVLTLAEQKDAVVVPSKAVQEGQQGRYVYVVKPDMTAEARPVVVAWDAGDETVVSSGIEPGETVVTDGQLRLMPGARVEIKNEKASADEAQIDTRSKSQITKPR